MSFFQPLKQLFEKAADAIITSEEGDERGAVAAAASGPRARPFLRQLMKQYQRQTLGKRLLGGDCNPSDYEAGEAILELAPELQVECAVDISARLVKWGGALSNSSRGASLKSLLGRFYRRSLPFTEADFVAILEPLASRVRLRRLDHRLYPIAGLLGRLEAAYGEEPLPPSLAPLLVGLRDELYRPEFTYAEELKLVNRLENLLCQRAFEDIEADEALPAVVDAWTARLAEVMGTFDTEGRRKWIPILLHWSQASTTRPNQNFRKEARALIEERGAQEIATLADEVLSAVGKAGPEKIKPASWSWGDGDGTLVHDRYCDHLRGLVWYGLELATPELIGRLAEVAERCYRKVRDFGPRSSKIANACVVALGETGKPEAIGQLTRLKNSVHYASARNQIDQAIERAADAMGMSGVEMEELSVPTLGLKQPGLLEENVGEHFARATFSGPGDVTLAWERPDGKRQASVPRALKESDPEGVKRVRARIRELKDQLDGQQKRLEQLFLQGASWAFGDWKKRYFDHPLVAVLARRLIWTFGGEDGIAVCRVGDGWRDVWGALVKEPGADTRVELWHPVEASEDQVEGWRRFLVERGITQPFKQAHREIYRISEAERANGNWSNRFAGHIVRQHQFAALCRSRGWRYTITGAWDSANTPTLALPAHAITVEFEVEATREEYISNYGVYLNLATKRVRFFRHHEEGPVALESVPARVFSEVMRDVDLFVSVSSIARDPELPEPGPDDPHFDYWKRERERGLTRAGEIRRQTLEALLPRLDIVGQCELDQSRLVVRGRIRSYAISLETAEVRMMPKNALLVINLSGNSRKKKAAAEEVALPYEGDSILADLLTRARLLVADDKITDVSLKARIREG